MAPHPSSFFALLVLGVFVVWRIIVRIRRLVGRQRIAPAWPWIAVVFFPSLLLLLFMVALAKDPRHPFALVLGAVVGGLLAYWGLRLTQFEKTREGFFYTPNAPIGLTLAALFVGRLAYRAWALYRAEANSDSLIAGFGQSPLTLGIFALAAGYYAVFAGGLLYWRHRRVAEEIAAERPGESSAEKAERSLHGS